MSREPCSKPARSAVKRIYAWFARRNGARVYASLPVLLPYCQAYFKVLQRDVIGFSVPTLAYWPM